MSVISLAEAKARLSELVDRAEAGESIDITRRGKTVARIAGASQPRKRVDVALLQSLTSRLPSSAQSAADLVRAMRDEDRF